MLEEAETVAASIPQDYSALSEDVTDLKSTITAIEAEIETLDGGLSETAKTLLITILRAGVYTSDQSDNIDALEEELEDSGDVSWSQVGSMLIFKHVPAITSVTQSGTTLVCA